MTTRQPADVFPPGDFLRDELDERGLTVADFATLIGLAESTVNRIITGHQRITPMIAEALGRGVGTSAEYWTNLDEAYRRK